MRVCPEHLLICSAHFSVEHMLLLIIWQTLTYISNAAHLLARAALPAFARGDGANGVAARVIKEPGKRRGRVSFGTQTHVISCRVILFA